MWPAAYLLILFITADIHLAPPASAVTPGTLLNLIIEVSYLIILLQYALKLRLQIRKVLLELLTCIAFLLILLLRLLLLCFDRIIVGSLRLL